MDCAAQGAELVGLYQKSSNFRLLDVGCGGGHFIYSLKSRQINADYFGLDSSPKMVKLARAAFKKKGFDPAKIILGDVSYLRGLSFDVAVVINTLSFNPDFRAPLDRLSQTGASLIIIRDNFGPMTVITYETDGYLDPDFNHLKGYWNRWSKKEVWDFLASLGYEVKFIVDKRAKGYCEKVVDKDYYWSWLVAQRA
jgi:ubiquinone/menaquinone biosynthesis C-methylase UbiE